MVTRMPQFGAAIKSLSALFEQVDAKPGDNVEPPFSPTIAETGRKLIGKDGFSCLTCHRYASYGDPKLLATDLAKITNWSLLGCSP